MFPFNFKSLNSRLVIVNSLILGITIFVILLFVSNRVRKRAFLEQKVSILENASKAEGRIFSFYESAKKDILFLSSTEQVKKFLKLYSEGISSDVETKNVQKLFISFMKNYSKYQEIRLIEVSKKGKELVRVNNYDGVKVVSKEMLQEKAHRDYFKAALGVPNDGIYMGNVTLRRESYFKTPQRSTPQIRILRPIVHKNKRILFLVLNLNFNYLVESLNNLFGKTSNIIIYNKEGHYIYNSTASTNDAFTFEFDKAPPLKSDFPAIYENKNVLDVKNGEQIYVNHYYLSKNDKYSIPSFGLIIGLKKEKVMLFAKSVIKDTFLAFFIGIFVIIILSRNYSKRTLAPLVKLASKINEADFSLDIDGPSNSVSDEIYKITSKISQYIYKIKENENFLKNIFDKSKDGFCLIDSNGIIKMTNASLEKIFGYEENELLGKNVEMLMPNEHAIKHQEYINKFFLTGSQNALQGGRELVAKKSDDSGIFIYLTVGEVKREDGEKSDFLGIVRDLTKFKEVQATLENEKSITEAESRFATLGKMISGVAHEINSPLQNVILTSEYIEELIKHDKKEEIKKEFLDLKLEIRRISDIISSMKSLTRGKSQTKHVKENLNQMLESVEKLIKHKIKFNSIDFASNFSCTENIFIVCNRSEIHQIILNLISNSIDALNDSNTKNPQITLSSSVNKDCVKVCVSDNGPGIEEALKDKIFEPLYTSKDVGKGSGLGLSISSRLARNNNMSLELVCEDKNMKTIFCLIAKREKV